jgi:hypothetical protein
LTNSYCFDMFRQLIACHPQGALMVLAKISIKHEHSSIVIGVAAYRGLVCAVYSVRVSCAGRYVDWHMHVYKYVTLSGFIILFCTFICIFILACYKPPW